MMKCIECKNHLAYDPEYLQPDCLMCATLQEVEAERLEGPVRCGSCQLQHLASPPYYDEECPSCALAQLEVDIQECEKCGFRWVCTLDDLAQETTWSKMDCPVCEVKRTAEIEEKAKTEAYRVMALLMGALFISIFISILLYSFR